MKSIKIKNTTYLIFKGDTLSVQNNELFVDGVPFVKNNSITINQEIFVTDSNNITIDEYGTIPINNDLDKTKIENKKSKIDEINEYILLAISYIAFLIFIYFIFKN